MIVARHTLLLHREDQHAAELQQYVADLTAARNGLQEQALRNEQLTLRLAKLLRERFGASSERLRGEVELRRDLPQSRGRCGHHRARGPPKA